MGLTLVHGRPRGQITASRSSKARLGPQHVLSGETQHPERAAVKSDATGVTATLARGVSLSQINVPLHSHL